ncbi:MAG TPA: acyl carrier protein [Terriglobales bacterium]|nr:acyl carrier protein [Terriglobales bacterium]
MSTAAQSVREQIHDFIQENLASVKGIDSFTDQDSLMESGIIDSLGIFRLVSFLEDTFGVRVADEEITPENLKSVEVIEELVNRKKKK